MTNNANHLPFAVEHITVPASFETSFEQSLEQLDHILFEFRQRYGSSDDKTLPVIRVYKKGEKTVTVYSTDSSNIAVQIEDASSKSVYAYDKGEQRAVILALSNGSEEKELTTFQLEASQENIQHITSMSDYVLYE